jgi:hypothetical protein
LVLPTLTGWRRAIGHPATACFETPAVQEDNGNMRVCPSETNQRAGIGMRKRRRERLAEAK